MLIQTNYLNNSSTLLKYFTSKEDAKSTEVFHKCTHFLGLVKYLKN